ncbi:helix-turn-helix domain-containing protein [Enterococcus mundtii]|uniref:helix-turn-helix domain-containing protein n=1 Tax=Enterococcus TaxID=1350 RepID=UPI0008E86504|nr:helix-turn-helix domain-containing protein [Enterococcus mundtii]MDB7088177.1 helix-turn-helix domain-containing protein [Enterococcus mundtii]SFL87211.1 AraC-type DNA-binding protein [Enterococcus mundtii]
MKVKMLELQNDLRERISHRNQYIPVTTCVDHFDDYFNSTWECHWHEEVEFSVVLKGSVEYIIFSSEKNTTTITLHHGEGIYVPSGKLHSVRALQEGTILAGLVFPISFFELTIFDNFYFNNISKVFDSHFPFIYLNTEESIDISITESIIEICGLTGTETGFELYCIELVSRIWRLLTSKMNHLTEKTMFCEESIQTQYMKAMLTFIHSNYGKCITVEEIAKHSGISRTECFRCFKKFLKKTPMEYTTSYRLSMATMLLTSTSRTIKDISSSCGFSTPEYFGKVFKKYLGTTPGQYRK